MRAEKPWGHEILIARTPKYAGKIIFVKKGHRLSLQYHKKKDECFYIQQGKLLIEIDGDDDQLCQSIGQQSYCFRILPMVKHRLKAIEDTTIFEVCTPELEDIHRIDDDCGRHEKKTRAAQGLP